MDIVETVKNNKAYTKYKILVKKWEKEFQHKNSRVPSKLDIKEAPAKVRYAYKQYFHMKSAALEESLLDCPLDDESACGSPEFPPLTDSMFDIPDFCIDNLPSTSQINLPSTSQIEQLLSSTRKPTSVKSPTFETMEVDPNKGPPDKISKKLFQNSKFSLRNPRKSNVVRLSQNKSLNQDMFDTSIRDEQVLIQPDSVLNAHNEFKEAANSNYKICDSGGFTVATSDINNYSKANTVRKINLGWLERAAGQSFESSHDTASQYRNASNYGMTNINITSAEKVCADYVENSESETDECSESLKPALKKRKLSNSQGLFSKISARSLIQRVDIIPKLDLENLENLAEVVDKSDKTIRKMKTSRRKTKPTKRKVLTDNQPPQKTGQDTSEPPNLEDFIPIGIEKDLTPRFGRDSEIFSKSAATELAAVLPTTICNKKRPSSAAEKLQGKIENGTLNENFVKINIKKKVFVRGKKSFNYSKYKKQQWKDKKALGYEMEFPEGGKITCFKCGNYGHMSRYCTAQRGDSLLPLEACPTDEVPSLDDMQNKIVSGPESDEITSFSQYVSNAVPDSFLQLLSQSEKESQLVGEIKPVYSNYTLGTTPKEVQDALIMFGHESFRSGQEEAIMRILSGQSTLLILSTGSGKSLCYQLPAYIYSKHNKCVTLVISPLVSLMDDQVLSMPEFLRAGCLHTNQTPTQRQNIMQYLKNGELNILLISPEALISGDRSNGLGSLFKSLPPIAFACIDEAHCVSQWSHNFRPSYLMICRVLREKLKVNCILGLTATASQPTIKSIIEHINVPDGCSGVITNPSLPPNLILSVSYERDKDRSLITLLGSEPFNSYDSIIVYCIRRDECERVASVLRSSLQEPGKVTTEKGQKRKRMSYLAEAYHAGLSGSQRKKIQDNFMKGTLNIIVATVAFGMGINKSNIRCIIHYNMPKSFESYVQEVGRAGRDGKIAQCHVFMNRDNNDKNELLKHIHSNTIDRNIIRKLLQRVFVPCECKNFEKNGCKVGRCKGHEVAFSIDETVEELDIASENISTMLCYLELHKKNYIQVLNNCYIMCKIYSYGGPQKLLDAAKNCPPLAMAYTLAIKNDKNVTKSNVMDFPVIDVAAAIGWESGIAKYHLKNLEWYEENGKSKRSALKVEFHTLGLRIRAPGDLTASEMDEMLDSLHERVQSQEKTMLYQLEEINRAFSKVAKNSVHELFTNSISEHKIFEDQSNELKEVIRKYFERDSVLDTDLELENRPVYEDRAIADIKAIISAYKDCTFTGRAIARILQGIPSPNYPAIVWGRCKFWRSHMHEDFHQLAKLATEQLIVMRH